MASLDAPDVTVTDGGGDASTQQCLWNWGGDVPPTDPTTLIDIGQG